MPGGKDLRIIGLDSEQDTRLLRPIPIIYLILEGEKDD